MADMGFFSGLNLDGLDYTLIAPSLNAFSDESLEKILKFDEQLLEHKGIENTEFNKIIMHDIKVVSFELWRRKNCIVMGEMIFRYAREVPEEVKERLIQSLIDYVAQVPLEGDDGGRQSPDGTNP